MIPAENIRDCSLSFSQSHMLNRRLLLIIECWSRAFLAKMATEYLVDSCVRGYHYYQNIWDPFIGEVLPCLPEDGNPHDRYAVAVKKLSGRVVGHVPSVVVDIN